MDVLKEKKKTLPLLLIAAGFLYRQCLSFVAVPLLRGLSQESMMPALRTITIISALVLFLLVALLLRRLCSRPVVQVSAFIMVGYNIILLIAELLAQRLGFFGVHIFSALYLPREISTEMASAVMLLPIWGTFDPLWPISILFLFSPLVYIFFCKRAAS